jgi:hypothetical protein
MRRLIIPTLAALTLLGAGLLLPNRADAVPLSAPGSLAAAIADNAIVQETRWRRWGWRRCWGCRRWGWRRHWRWRYSDVDLKQDVVQVGKLKRRWMTVIPDRRPGRSGVFTRPRDHRSAAHAVAATRA